MTFLNNTNKFKLQNVLKISHNIPDVYSLHFLSWQMIFFFLIHHRLEGKLLLVLPGFAAEYSCQSPLKNTADFQHFQDDLKIVSY